MRSAAQWVTEGDLKFESNEFEGAIADYTEAINLEPDNPDFHYNRGLANFFAKNIAAASGPWPCPRIGPEP
jgi:tetratricopeptide (TPR) repeat protein